ncbi:MAG: penicillin acylase family protein [Tepidiformaceae bacterium]
MTIASSSQSTSVQGQDGPIAIRRDAYGIAHVTTSSARDAWFGQGFVSAEDRLWQMEYDRRRAVGRWSEAAGGAGLAADIMARKLGLESPARADVEAMGEETRAMFEAYAAGVNAWLRSGAALPPEYALTGILPEPWEAWHSVAVFKVRHILMGLWQSKMALGGLLARVGFETWRELRILPPLATSLILPPGGPITRLFDQANEEIAAAADHLGFLSEVEAGSNSWVVSGARTTTGQPVICNDSHRALDVPNAYWQVNLACPEFDVAGATFAGFPGFPHFGFNGSVAWNITHTQADYQDLFVERFEGPDGDRYLSPAGWREAEQRSETITVRGAEPVTVECWRTEHGAVVHGDPRNGHGIALKYTATAAPTHAFEGLGPTVRAQTVEELFDAQRTWVDPVNNLVAADSQGSIGFMVRGELPVRASTAGRLVPVPGWTGEHEWTGVVPFEALPRSINPPEGFIATANQRVVDGDEPYISEFFAPPGRADRLVELLGGGGTLSPQSVAAFQGDLTSVPARAWATFLASQQPLAGSAEQARALLGSWDGELRGECPEALVYALFRRYVLRGLFAPIVGEETWAWLTSEANPGLGRIVAGLASNVAMGLASGGQPLGGRPWAAVLEPALAAAWETSTQMFGPDSSQWRWDGRHTTGSKHPLASSFQAAGESFNPPRIPLGGDGDTLQCAGYGASGRNDFVITATSVYRQVVDFADPDGASYIVPGGASGEPGSPHYQDQLPLWQRHERIPMDRAK